MIRLWLTSVLSAAVAWGFVLSPNYDQATHDVHLSKTKTILHARSKKSTDGLKTAELQAIYEIQSIDENRVAELRKSAARLTKAMRQVEVDYTEDLAAIDARINRLQQEKEYVKFAYVCYKHHVSTGYLKMEFSESEEDSDKNRLYLQARKIQDTFDEELYNSTIAKFGFEFVRIETGRSDYDYGRSRHKCKCIFTFSLTPENTSHESEQD